jgi:16S rRNA (guanine527-N7)-methyltransferase
MTDHDWCRQLAAGARGLGLELSPKQLEQFSCYLEELRRWNRAYNLTRIIAPEAVARGHFLDSLNYLPGLDESACDPVLDLGTGPGFPGLPLALVRPESEFLLCESRGKKTLFLEHLIGLLKLDNVTIINLHLSRQNAKTVIRRPVSAVVCRAVNLLRDVVPVAAELLSEQGVLLFTEAAPESGGIRRKLEQNWPGLCLSRMEKCLLPGRAPDLYLGRITRRPGHTPKETQAN